MSMPISKYDRQLEHILVAIIRDYELPLLPHGWRKAGDLPLPSHEMVTEMLRHHALLVLVADKANLPDQEQLKAALNECARLYGQLYDYVSQRLFGQVAAERLDVAFYEASEFVVLVLQAPIGPVVQAIGSLVVPFVREHHYQQRPDDATLAQMANDLLAFLLAAKKVQLRPGIIHRIEPLLTTALRPLPVVPSPSPTATNGSHPPAPPDDEPPTVPHEPLDEVTQPPEDETRTASDDTGPTIRFNVRRNGSRRAPLPYDDIKRKRSER
jgi:hypothetical protein